MILLIHLAYIGTSTITSSKQCYMRIEEWRRGRDLNPGHGLSANPTLMVEVLTGPHTRPGYTTAAPVMESLAGRVIRIAAKGCIV